MECTRLQSGAWSFACLEDLPKRETARSLSGNQLTAYKSPQSWAPATYLKFKMAAPASPNARELHSFITIAGRTMKHGT